MFCLPSGEGESCPLLIAQFFSPHWFVLSPVKEEWILFFAYRAVFFPLSICFILSHRFVLFCPIDLFYFVPSICFIAPIKRESESCPLLIEQCFSSHRTVEQASVIFLPHCLKRKKKRRNEIVFFSVPSYMQSGTDQLQTKTSICGLPRGFKNEKNSFKWLFWKFSSRKLHDFSYFIKTKIITLVSLLLHRFHFINSISSEKLN
jgi:hypothetical protein